MCISVYVFLCGKLEGYQMTGDPCMISGGTMSARLEATNMEVEDDVPNSADIRQSMYEDMQWSIENRDGSNPSLDMVFRNVKSEGLDLKATEISSVWMTFACTRSEAPTNLKNICEDGTLAAQFEQALVTEEFKRTHGLKTVNLTVSFYEWEYELCLKELQEDTG